jgi:uncharacterized membrane protein (Fun14 family)
LGYFIRKSIKVIAFIGGMFFFIIAVLFYIKTIDNLSVLQRGVEDAFETSVNRTIDISNQVLAKSGGDLSIPLFVFGFIVGFGLGLNNGRSRKSGLNRRLITRYQNSILSNNASLIFKSSALIQFVYDMGWTQMLLCLKVYVEYGKNLREFLF